MVFEEFVNTRVVIVQKDGFTKIGILRSVDDGFLKLEFLDGSAHFVRIDSLMTLSPYKENFK